MKSIYKYQLEPGETVLSLRGNVLSTGVQHDDIMVWAVYDDTKPVRAVRINVMGTWHRFVDASESDFIGTVFIDGGLVFHVFATPEASS
jgi:hypothetical protein